MVCTTSPLLAHVGVHLQYVPPSVDYERHALVGAAPCFDQMEHVLRYVRKLELRLLQGQPPDHDETLLEELSCDGLVLRFVPFELCSAAKLGLGACANHPDAYSPHAVTDPENCKVTNSLWACDTNRGDYEGE